MEPVSRQQQDIAPLLLTMTDIECNRPNWRSRSISGKLLDCCFSPAVKPSTSSFRFCVFGVISGDCKVFRGETFLSHITGNLNHASVMFHDFSPQLLSWRLSGTCSYGTLLSTFPGWVSVARAVQINRVSFRIRVQSPIRASPYCRARMTIHHKRDET